MRSMSWEDFLATPAGRTVLAWEEGACARFLAGKTGDRALQVGLGALNPFAASPITHRILIEEFVSPKAGETDFRDRVVAQPEALPISNECCDVVVLAHTLECGEPDMNAVLAEAARVLSPNGLLVLLFFNPMGGWALRQRFFASHRMLPDNAASIAIPAIKAGIAQAGLTLEGGNFGVYAVNPDPNPANVRLPSWIDKAGDRWWPTLSNVILLSARKLDASATLVGKVNFAARKSGKAVTAALRHSEKSGSNQ